MLMQHLSRRIPKSLNPSIATLLNHSSSSSTPIQPHHQYTTHSLQTPLKHQTQSIPCEFRKWGSLGFFRTSKFATGFTPLQRKPLDSIVDIERAKNFSAEDLVSIWDDYHLGRGHIGASMKTNLYRLLEQRASPWKYALKNLSAPRLVLTEKKGDLELQSISYKNKISKITQMPCIIFTGLEDYKTRGTQASPYFTVTYYTEFAESKDTVLIRGDVVFASKLSDTEAQWLLETAQSFYLNDNRYKLVERFNKETHDFEFKDVLQALEMPIV